MIRSAAFVGGGFIVALVAVQFVVLVGLGGGSIGQRCEVQAPIFGPAPARANSSQIPEVPGFDGEQMKIAATIVTVAKQEGIPERGWIIGVGVAMQESTLLKDKTLLKPNGDGDSGLFQQRQFPGWYGTLEEVNDPAYASRTFYTGKDIVTDGLSEEELNAAAGPPGYHIPGLKDIDGWEEMTLSEAGQAVQRSADGSWYDKRWPDAERVVEAVADVEIDLDDPSKTGDGDPIETMPCDDGEDEPGGGGKGGDYPKGWREPGPWGGYDNGKIDVKELCPAPWQKEESLRCDAMDNLGALNTEFKKAFGADISITDSYRDYDEQVATKKAKGNLAAKPGTSKHGWALALDLGSNINSYTSKQHQWMRDNAGKYGWILPEWAQQNGSKPEPWHWEYWGVKGDE